uniref:GIY-YIG endonuclease n=1 Tax=Fusarium asiaticum TaxID=282267 RepID=A0A6M5BN57_FUSAS|nr:GIY-YIG endonuclease [Fusarium asiaticum]YP_010391086.1 GIY-YIG endonuclease [Fusarium nepalense]UPX02680.1 GIY-YIG endonuclease [Fusarium vorosii]QJT58192.1 GIY-YIG endonuclease [Fusarium asiaticum]QJT58247.1 GIY-YIG endonuclease [Fusarium asiaticum]QJT58302.1 GIY-YIG endonuclease [Fusarium asiaticum]QJT58357.1 GIY-YIG endonuclease [Fusarium asiaticum]
MDLSSIILFIYSRVLFAARSTKGIIRLSPSERAAVKLPDESKEVLIGILLGDAQVNSFDNALSIVVKRLKLYYDLSILFIYLYFANFKVVYINPSIEKAKILKENKGKSGIYLWTNQINGKRYVGSALDLSKRFRNYFNTSYLTDRKDIMIIYKALLTHGFDNFTLEILEYCESSVLIEREQYYIDLLNPEYNILKIAGSRLGAKHTLEAIAKIKAGALNRSKEALAKNLEHLNKLNSSQEHKDHLIRLNTSIEQIAKTANPVIVLNILNGESLEFRSITQAAKFLEVHPEIIRRHIVKEKLYLDKYLITKVSK